MNRDPRDIMVDMAVPLVGAILYQFLCWSWMRSMLGNRPPTPFMRVFLHGYGFFGALGMGYIFAIGSLLGWPQTVRVTLIVLWVASLGGVAYWRYRRNRVPELPDKKIGIHWTPLLQTLLLIGLLISLIGTVIELGLIVTGQSEYLRSHLVRSILWPSGVALTILLARKNRRAIMITASRAFLGLLIIGALMRPGLAGFSIAVLAGIALFVLSRYVSSSPPSKQNLNDAPADTLLRS